MKFLGVRGSTRRSFLKLLGGIPLVSMWLEKTVHGGGALSGPDKNNLVIGTNREPDQLNPWEGQGAHTKANIMGLFYIGLTYFDNEGRLQPGLATQVPSQSNGRVRINRNASGKFVSQEVDWTIRDNAKWSDGTDITTDDVTFTLEVQNNQLIPVPFRIFSNIVTEIKVKDKKNFTIVYNDPNLFFASPMYHAGLSCYYDIAPKHIWEPIFRDAVKEVQANPSKAADIIQQKFLGADAATGKDPSKVVGSGPFKFAEWQKNQFTRFTRRSDFFLPAPGDPKNYVQEVTIRFFTATETALSAFLAGELDASDHLVLRGQDPAIVKQQLGDRGNVEVSPTGSIEQFVFNNFTKRQGVDLPVCQTADDLLLGDKRTRQAIIQALDRNALRTVFPGAIGSNSFVVRGDLGFNDRLNHYPRNLEAAKKLLADLGWTPGAGGILQRKTADGRTVFFRLPHVTTPTTYRVRTQQLLQQQLKDVGIAVEPSNQPASVLFSNEFVSGSNCNWQGIIEICSCGGIAEAPADSLSTQLLADDPDTKGEFDNIPRESNGYAGSNISGWVNRDYDKLYFQALSQFDLNARADTLKKMQEIFSDELPFISLYEEVTILAAKTGLVNYTTGLLSELGTSWNAWEWGWTQNGAKKVR